jgi:ribose transport system ATP-binding protein
MAYGGEQSFPEYALAICNLSKSYGATRALRDVSFNLRKGEVHALIGANGAGKSTLVKILSGIVVPDAGRIEVGGAPFRPRSLMAARAAGVSTVFQELSLLPNLTVADNLMLPRLIKGFACFTSRRANEARASEILAEFGVSDIAANARVGDLSLAEKQRIEIVRALSQRPRALILDEPTAALAQPEWLFHAVERMAAAGTAILYITHRLAEVRRLCERATLLTDGRKVDTVALADTSDADIVRMIVGAEPAQNGAGDSHQPVGGPIPAIGVRDVRGATIAGVSFDLWPGEIVGVAALGSHSQRELFRMLGGMEPRLGGSVEVGGHSMKLTSPAQALHAGIGVLPEERKTEGVFLGLRVLANISLPIIDELRRFGIIDLRRERQRVAGRATEVDLAARHIDMPVAALSGGNQQKVLLARVLESGARTLLLFDPTRGVDVGTKQVVYGVIRRFAEAGGSVLIYSTELADLVQLAHRCLVLHRGRLVGEVAGEALSEERLFLLATGHGESTTIGPEPSQGRLAARRLATMLGNGSVIAAVILLALLFVYGLRQNGALGLFSLTGLLNNALPVAIAAAGATLVVLTREFDLSVAGVVALSNVLIVALIGDASWAPASGLALALTLGLAVGMANGLLVAYLELPSVAVTLGSMIICSGLALLVLAAPGGDVGDAMVDGLTGTVGPIPVAALIAAGVVLLWLAIRYTDWGIALYAVGADPTAASLAGISTWATRLRAFCLAGMFYGLAGYMLTAFTATGDPNAGKAYLILVYAAIAIGGTSFSGGRGGLIGSMIGAVILTLLQKVLFSLGILSFYMGIVEGLIMILAVMVGAFAERMMKPGSR